MAQNVVYKGNRVKFLQNEGAMRELFESRGKFLVKLVGGSVLGDWVRYGRWEERDPSKWEGQSFLMQLRQDLWREGGYRIW